MAMRSGTAPRPGPDPSPVTQLPEPLALAGRIAGEQVDELPALSIRISEQILRDVPELGEGEELGEQVRASAEANLMTIFWMLTQGVPAERAEAPAAAVELVRETVHRGNDLSAVQRMYRFGQAIFSSWWIQQLTERIDDPKVLARTVDASLTFVHTYLDGVVVRLTEEYARERERWVRSSAAVRADVVGAILAGQEVDVDKASTRLGYELRRQHLGLVAWSESDPEDDQQLPRLEQVILGLADALGCHRPLLVPAGGSVLWAWLSAPDTPDEDDLVRAHEGVKGARHIWIASGAWCDGAEGLRRSHEDAMHARRVARDGARPSGTLTRYADVAVASLLSDDIDRARRFVQETLGPLASQDESSTRLRETLSAFLEAGSSHVAAGRKLHVHQNTVAYRVRRAEELLRTPIASRRLELEIALAIASALGSAVLGSADS